MSDETIPEVGLSFDEEAAAAAVSAVDILAGARAQVEEIQARLDAARAVIPLIEAELAEAQARLEALGG